MSYTPGPWRVSARDPAYVERDLASVATVARCYDPSRANADARLIAAAPALYEALLAAYEYLSTIDGIPGDRSVAVEQAARAALALARGEGAT